MIVGFRGLGALVASFTYLAGFAALLHGAGRLCLGKKATLLSALYVSLAVATMGYAVYKAGDGLESDARWAGGFIPVMTVLFALLLWIPSLLDLRRLRADGSSPPPSFAPQPRSAWRRNWPWRRSLLCASV